jgi:hypothetical protein
VVDRWRTGRHEPFEHPSGVGLHAGQDVLVRLDREGGRGVTEPFAHDLDGNAGCDEQRAVGVAQQPDDRHAGASGDALEGLRDGVGMDGLTRNLLDWIVSASSVALMRQSSVMVAMLMSTPPYVAWRVACRSPRPFLPPTLRSPTASGS